MKQIINSTQRGAWYLIKKMGCATIWLIAKAMRYQLQVDRKLIKRYLNLETPIYKLWWESYSNAIQKKLDAQHK